MSFEEALDLAKKKINSCKYFTSKGAILDEIIIAPTDVEEYKQFKQISIQTLDVQKSVIPFMQSDLVVLGVFDKYHIRKDNLLLISEI